VSLQPYEDSTLTAVRSVEPIVPKFRRKSFSVPFVSFPAV